VSQVLRRVVLGLLVALVAAGCSAGGHQQAVERATAQVRARAVDTQRQLKDVLAAPDIPAGGEVLAGYVLQRMPAGPDFVIFAHEQPGPRQVVLRVAITAMGTDSGGIGGVTEEFVRLCVELSGNVAARPAVELRDTSCDGEAVRATNPDARQDVRVTTTLHD
jgi:hypothetical protein